MWLGLEKSFLQFDTKLISYKCNFLTITRSANSYDKFF